MRLKSIYDDHKKIWLRLRMLHGRPNIVHHNRDVSLPYLHHQKTMSILIDEMTQCHGERCRTDQVPFMSADIVATYYGQLTR